MFADSRLDAHTLLVCGQLLLTLMAAALVAVRPVPGVRSRTLPLWIASLAIFIVPGLLMSFATVHAPGPHPAFAPPQPGPGGPPPSLGGGVMWIVQLLLIQSSVFQAMALREVSRALRSWKSVAAVSAMAFVVPALAARLLPGHGMHGLALAHAAIPLVAWRSLRRLATQGVGGLAVAVIVVLGALPSWAQLLGPPGLGERDIPLTILCDLLMLFGASLGLLLWQQANIHRLLARVATSDALTGALNRHGFAPRLEAELARARRHGHAVSVVACDLDHFKRVNDRHGHHVGDEVLRAFVQRARGVLRSSDIIGRLGGEEFVFVLVETGARKAVQILDRMRAMPLPVNAGSPQVTFSAGVATASGATGYDAARLLELADRRLYVAKETRDRIVADADAGDDVAAPAAPAARPAVDRDHAARSGCDALA